MKGAGSGAAADGGAVYTLGIFGAWVYFWAAGGRHLGDGPVRGIGCRRASGGAASGTVGLNARAVVVASRPSSKRSSSNGAPAAHSCREQAARWGTRTVSRSREKPATGWALRVARTR